jgi:hypothetical protein
MPDKKMVKISFGGESGNYNTFVLMGMIFMRGGINLLKSHRKLS